MTNTYQPLLKGNSVGIVFGTFAPLHQGHLDLIMRAKKENDGGCLVIVSGRQDDRGNPLMPVDIRYRYVREFFSNDNKVSVYCINETELNIPNYPNGWNGFMKEILKIFEQGAVGEKVFYVSELEYAKTLQEIGYQVKLSDRQINPISATMIRNNPLKYWDKITYPFKRVFSKNILIIGTASEGKTTLTQDLGKYFNTAYSIEYAREYMKESHISEWELKSMDYMNFLLGQYETNKREINSPKNRGIFFADSDSITTKMYAKYYGTYGESKMSQEEIEKISILADYITSKCKWDKIFLLCPQSVYENDNTRDMAFSGINERQEMFNFLCQELKNCGLWKKTVVLKDGNYYTNFETIKNYIKEVIKYE